MSKRSRSRRTLLTIASPVDQHRSLGHTRTPGNPIDAEIGIVLVESQWWKDRE